VQKLTPKVAMDLQGAYYELPVNLKKSKITDQNTIRAQQPQHNQNTTKTQSEHDPNTIPSATVTCFVESNCANSIVAMMGSVLTKKKTKIHHENDDFPCAPALCG
jgi:hypothetical protein